MYQEDKSDYDRSSTMFSPDGRLHQVEYARESIKKGTTSIGIKGTNGVALIVEKNPGSKLTITESIEKVFKIDDHIGMAASGLIGDARVLIDRARLTAHSHWLNFEESINVDMLTKDVANIQQYYTQNSGLRPFGTSLLIIGMDEDGSTHLFETDPSGAMLEYKATVVGKNKENVLSYIEEHYNDDLTIEDCILMAVDALQTSADDVLDPTVIEIGLIEEQNKKFMKLDFEKIKTFAKKMNKK